MVAMRLIRLCVVWTSILIDNKLKVTVLEGVVVLKNQAGDFTVSAGHSALISDMLLRPEFMKLENRVHDRT